MLLDLQYTALIVKMMWIWTILFLDLMSVFFVKGSTDIASRLILLHFDADETTQRELPILPDNINVKIEEVSGTRHELRLERQRQVDVNKVRVITDDDELNSQLLSKPDHFTGFYQDLDTMSAVSVKVQTNEGKVTKSLTGTLLLGGQGYEIHPTTDHPGVTHPLLKARELGLEEAHRVHTLTPVDLRELYSNLNKDGQSPHNYETRENTPSQSAEAENTTTRDRVRRLASQYKKHENFHVEIQFVIDYTVYEFWKKGKTAAQAAMAIKYYFTHVLNGMHMAYRKIDYNLHRIKITIWLADIFIITQKNSFLKKSYTSNGAKMNIDKAIPIMRNWIKSEGYDWSYPDHVLLWTKKQLMNNQGYDLLGVSYRCGICEPGYEVSINRDLGFYVWMTAAHELGHNLGSQHDGPKGNKCPEKASGKIHIMATSAYELTSKNLQFALTFSECSIEQMKKCLTAVENVWWALWPRVCVYDHVCKHEEGLMAVELLPGQVYNKDLQCQMFVKSTSSFTYDCWQHDFCKHMYCDNGKGCKKGKGITNGKEFRAAPGTKCDKNNDKMVCYDGECININTVYGHAGDLEQDCTATDLSPPSGCTDTNKKFKYDNKMIKCEAIPASYPWECFTNKNIKKQCKASCFRYGLFYTDKPEGACKLLATATPSPTTTTKVTTTKPTTTTTQPTTTTKKPTTTTKKPTTTTQKITTTKPTTTTNKATTSTGHTWHLPPTNVLHIMHCDTIYSKKGGVRCPSTPETCVPMEWFCDGIYDCPNWEDEDQDFCHEVPCPYSNYVRCKHKPNICIHESKLCDGKALCPDGSDENRDWCYNSPRYCYNKYRPKHLGYNCPNNKSLCVPDAWTCDGSNDCGAHEGHIGDESMVFCNSLCSWGQVRCPAGKFKCLPVQYACDGYKDCEARSDEKKDWCNRLPKTECHHNYVNCPGYQFRCIPAWWMCDGNNDCVDNSDETTYCKNKDKTQREVWYESKQEREIGTFYQYQETERDDEKDWDARHLDVELVEEFGSSNSNDTRENSLYTADSLQHESYPDRGHLPKRVVQRGRDEDEAHPIIDLRLERREEMNRQVNAGLLVGKKPASEPGEQDSYSDD